MSVNKRLVDRRLECPMRFACWILIALALVGLSIQAHTPPDSTVNPQTGFIETVDARWSGVNWEIRRSVDPGPGQSITNEDVCIDSNDDVDPRLDISAAGNTWVTWWRDLSTDQVHIRKHTLATKTWGSDRLISSENEDSHNPEIAYDGTSPWVAYEVHGASSQSIAVGIISDEPDPIGVRTILRTTSYSGDADVDIHAEGGHLWVTWVDSGSHVGWSEHDANGWSVPSYESYSGSSVAAARSSIRAAVLGL